MSSTALADLVKEALERQEPTNLSIERRDEFHRKFQSDVSNEVDEMRAEKRRAYEELRHITLR